MRPLSYGAGICCLLLLSLFQTSCTDLIFDAPYPDPGQGKVAVVFSRPELLLPEGTEEHFGKITSLRLIATNLKGEVVYNGRLRYKGADRNLSWRQLACSDPVVLDQSTYEFFFIANEEGIGIQEETFQQINSKQALLRLTYFIPLSRPERRQFLIPLVGHLQRQLPRQEETDRTIILYPQLAPSVALLEVETKGLAMERIELGFPKDREDGGLFGYPYSKASDRRHQMHYYPLTPLEKGGTLYCVGLPEVRCYAPEQQQWRGPELSDMTHLRIQLTNGETKLLPLMQLPEELLPNSYEEYLRIAMEPAPIGINGLIERFTIFPGGHYRYQLRNL